MSDRAWAPHRVRARALWDAGADRRRALQLAALARTAYRGTAEPQAAGAVAAWLANRR